jgi:hypothetical protein
MATKVGHLKNVHCSQAKIICMADRGLKLLLCWFRLSRWLQRKLYNNNRTGPLNQGWVANAG